MWLLLENNVEMNKNIEEMKKTEVAQATDENSLNQNDKSQTAECHLNSEWI